MGRLEVRPDLPLDAAEEIGDARLLPALLRLRDSGWSDVAGLADAIERCHAGR
jgi:hypothetical protein